MGKVSSALTFSALTSPGLLRSWNLPRKNIWKSPLGTGIKAQKGMAKPGQLCWGRGFKALMFTFGICECSHCTCSLSLEGQELSHVASKVKKWKSVDVEVPFGDVTALWAVQEFMCTTGKKDQEWFFLFFPCFNMLLFFSQVKNVALFYILTQVNLWHSTRGGAGWDCSLPLMERDAFPVE